MHRVIWQPHASGMTQVTAKPKPVMAQLENGSKLARQISRITTHSSRSSKKDSWKRAQRLTVSTEIYTHIHYIYIHIFFVSMRLIGTNNRCARKEVLCSRSRIPH